MWVIGILYVCFHAFYFKTAKICFLKQEHLILPCTKVRWDIVRPISLKQIK